MQIQDLADRISAARRTYYQGTNELVLSDAAYDALEDQLRALDPQHPLLAQVGAPAASGAWVKVRHSIPMGSLNKAQEERDLAAWWTGSPVCISHKLDGISVSLQYVDGVLTQALTRGDGETGEDITRNVTLMQGAVRRLPVKGRVWVRGEIICRKSDFALHFQGESNPRNTASGTAKRQTNADKCKHLTVIAYQYLPAGFAPHSKLEELVTLEQLGFEVPAYYEAKTLQEAMAVYDAYVASKRVALDYEIDGLVLDIDDRDTREGLGALNGRPRGAVAFKFPSDQKATILQGVEWQVGKSGRITPVAVFDTVKLAGADVSRASLHNQDNIEALCDDAKATCLHRGDQILVSRRNDVIPFVESLLTPNTKGAPLALPAQCPDCGAATVRDGAYLKCPNSDSCPAQIAGAVKRWLSKTGVLHFGDALVDLLCESGKVETIADLYDLDPQEIAQMGMGGRQVGGTATKAFKNLHAASTMPLHVFIGSLGIPHIGRSMAKTIVDAGFDRLKKMSHAKVPEIAAIPGVGPVKAEAFCEGFWDLLDRGVITGLLKHVTIADKAVGAMSGKSVCMTGFRDKQMEDAIEAQGGTVKSSVGKGLTILVAKDPKSTSGKAKDAAKFGVEVIGVDEMWDRLGGKP